MRLSEGNYYPFSLTHIINSIMFFNFSRVGLSPTQFILDAGDVARIEALVCDRSAPIECTCGPPDPINARALIKKRYNGLDSILRGAS